jgi:hypothetical protein
MQVDYNLISGLEEWVGGTYRITHDFYRLIIHTEKAQKKLWHYFGKMAPLNSVIKLTEEELEEIRYFINCSKDFCAGLVGLLGSYRVKAFTLDTFYNNEDALATDDELKYEFEWANL